MERVAFVIPTLNEASSIGKVLDQIPIGDLRKNGYETSVYVIDGLSVDNTRDIAAEKGAQLILEKRKGNRVLHSCVTKLYA
jgi:glycosyltransferase involved in cell wall biosynthesis